MGQQMCFPFGAASGTTVYSLFLVSFTPQAQSAAWALNSAGSRC